MKSKLLKAPCMRDFVRMAKNGWDQGWHERNGGNLSYRMTDADVDNALDELRPKRWHDLPEAAYVPELSEEHFIITAAGSHFVNIKRNPEACLGIIELDEQGKRWRKCWGFEDGKTPTSELSSHLLAHKARNEAVPNTDRVIYHCHPSNISALTFVLPLEDSAFTNVLWRTISECALVFPEGVAVVPWMVPGSVDLGLASAEKLKRVRAVIWPHHGLFCTGATFDDTFGLAHTIEKAAEIQVKVCSMTDELTNSITPENLRKMSEAYSLGLEL